MASTYFFKAVASDGKIRTGMLSAETDKLVARELRRQGLTPVYVGLEERKKSFDLKMPVLGGSTRKDVLFFTQELSTLLSAGVPLDRCLSITAELTDRTDFKSLVLDILRILKGGKPLAEVGGKMRDGNHVSVDVGGLDRLDLSWQPRDGNHGLTTVADTVVQVNFDRRAGTTTEAVMSSSTCSLAAG